MLDRRSGRSFWTGRKEVELTRTQRSLREIRVWDKAVAVWENFDKEIFRELISPSTAFPDHVAHQLPSPFV